MSDVKPAEEHGRLFIRYRDRGEVQAFEQLMQIYHRPLYIYLYRMLHKQEEAEDALQEVWFKIIRQKDSYQDQGQFSAWLYRVAHNYCLDWFRKQKSRPQIEETQETEAGESILDGIAGDDPTPLEALMENEKLIHLEAALQELSPLIREVYLLRTVQEISFKEIAEIQQCPIGTVLSRMHHAVKQLQARLSHWVEPSRAGNFQERKVGNEF